MQRSTMRQFSDNNLYCGSSRQYDIKPAGGDILKNQEEDLNPSFTCTYMTEGPVFYITKI